METNIILKFSSRLLSSVILILSIIFTERHLGYQLGPWRHLGLGMKYKHTKANMCDVAVRIGAASWCLTLIPLCTPPFLSLGPSHRLIHTSFVLFSVHAKSFQSCPTLRPYGL